MKLAPPFLVMLFAACRVVAQQPAADLAMPATNALVFRLDPSLSSLLLEDTRVTRQDVIVGKNLQFSGPLVRPLKAKTIGGVPVRILRLSNPLGPAEPKVEVERVGGESSRAWSSVAGWHPGASGFPNPITHESRLNLISVSRKARP